MDSLNRSRLIARTELRRSSRAFRTNRYQLLATATFGLFFLLPMLVFGSLAARGMGEALAAGESIGGFDLVAVLRTGVAVYWAMFAFFVASRAVGKSATIDEADGILTTVPVRTALCGILLSETVLVALWLVPPVLVLVGAFAFGAGTPLILLTTASTLVLVMASAVPVGYLVGLGIRHLLTVNATLARYKTALGVFAFVCYFGALAFAESLFVDLVSTLGRLPLGWLADLALVGMPGVTPSLLQASAAVGLSTLLVPLAVLGTIRLADRHWFGDPARDSRPTARIETRERRLAALDGLLSQQTRAVAHVVWLRARRAPIRLLYAAYPLFGLLIFANDLSTFLSYLPMILTLYVIWAAGVAFTLNPLGDQAGALAATLTTPLAGEQFVRGHLLVGAAVFVPLGVFISTTSALVVGYAPTRIVLLGVVSAVCTIGSATLAIGIGTLFPRFGAVRLSGSHEAVMPSKSAFAAYSLVIALAVAALAITFSEGARTVVSLLVSGLLLSRFSLVLAPDTLLTVAVIGLIVLLTSPLVAYVHAVRTFDRFDIS